MQSFSRGMALLVVVMAVLVFTASVAAVLGIWIANTPVTNAILKLIDPFISTLQAAEDAIGNVDKGLGNVQDVVTNLQAFLDSAGLVKELLPGVVGTVVDIANSLANLQLSLADTGIKVVDAREMLETIQSGVAYWIDLASIFLSILFLWIAFSQVSLFIHGWFYFSGKNLLEKRALDGRIPASNPDRSNHLV